MLEWCCCVGVVALCWSGGVVLEWWCSSHHTCTPAGTGFIQFDEFCSILLKKMKDDEDEREMREMFKSLDKDKRGEVNTDELR